jgi:type IV pilus assembly protein PilN
MRIPINLASEPFRRDRAMLVASIGVSLLLLATLGALASLILADRAQMADVRHDIDRLNREIRRQSAEETRLTAVLNRPENAEVLERSRLLNEILDRKGISWTKIFSDLETVVPHNVKITQIRPTVNSQNEVVLDMIVGAESPAPATAFMKAMENSPLFGSVEIHNQLTPNPPGEPLWSYRLTVNYAQKL